MPFLAGQQAWNRGKTKEDDPRVRKISETFKARRIDNFTRWRQEARLAGKIPLTHVPLARTEQLAFLIGLILGDGHIQKFPRSERLRIVLGTDKPLLWRHAAEAVRSVFSKEPWVQQRKGSASIEISLYQTRLSERLGVPAGSRGKLTVRLPEWIRSERRHLVACLKGLFEAEGSYSVHAPTYTYNLSFSNRNPALLDEVERALASMGFHPERRSYAVRLRKKHEAARFIELIRFRSYNS
jgi:DNA-binding transcriptional regulator WhiA